MRKPPAQPPASQSAAALLRSALSEAVEETDRAKTSYDASRAYRDDLIRDAAELIPVMKLARLTNLSRDRIYTILNRTNDTVI